MELHQYKNEELIDELSSRFDSFIYSGLRARDGENRYTTHYDGDELICLGLTDKIKVLINMDDGEKTEEFNYKSRF